MVAPLNFSASQEEISSPAVRLNWSLAAGAEGYRIYRAQSPYGPFSLLDTVKETGYLDYPLCFHKSYYYYAVSVDNFGGESEPTQVISVFLQDGLLVKVSADEIDSFQIVWSNQSGASCYSVYRSFQYAGAYELIGSTDETHLVDEGLCLDTTYYYKVISNTGLEGIGAGKTGNVSLTVSVRQSDRTSIQLEWSSVSNAAEYRIYRSAFPGNYRLIAVTAKNNQTYTDIGLSPNTAYWYQVISSNGASGTTSGKTDSNAIALEIVPASNTSLFLSWNAVGAEQCYSLYRAQQDEAGSFIARQTQTTYLDDGLLPNTAYRYWIVAEDGSIGEGSGTTGQGEFRIQYENLRGAQQFNPTSYRENSPSIVLTDPSPITGFQFSGWYTQLTGGQPVTIIPQGSSGNVILFARWVPNHAVRTISYFGNDAGGPSAEWVPFPASVPDGAYYELSNAVPTRRGYQFTGWNTEAGGNGVWYRPGKRLDSVGADLQLYAQWILCSSGGFSCGCWPNSYGCL